LIGARGPEYRRDDTLTQMDGQGHTFAGKASWYVFDGLGSVVGEVDPSGNLTSSPKYDVYGAVRSNGGSASSKQGFVGSLGHVSDDTGLIYMRARYYDSNLGRFASEDPAGHGLNWFVYCGDNPVNLVDTTGKVELPPVPDINFTRPVLPDSTEAMYKLIDALHEFSEIGNPAHWHAKLAEKALDALNDYFESGGDEASGECAEFNLEVFDQLSQVGRAAGLGADATIASDEVETVL
jgi:RHS repeat-associated protein